MQKKLLSLLFACTLAMSTMVTTGCNSLTIVEDIQKFLPAITNVATAACAFVQNPVCQTGSAAVEASATIAINELQKYLAAVQAGTATPSMWDYLNTAMSQFESDAASIFSIAGSVPPNVQAEIEALVASAQVLLAVIETLVPTSPAAKVAAVHRFGAELPPGKFSLNSWVSSYNGKVDSCQRYLPRTVKLSKIHAHSLLLRVIPGVH